MKYEDMTTADLIRSDRDMARQETRERAALRLPTLPARTRQDARDLLAWLITRRRRIARELDRRGVLPPRP